MYDILHLDVVFVLYDISHLDIVFFIACGVSQTCLACPPTLLEKNLKIERLMNICWCGGVKVIFPWHLNENWLTLHPINKCSMKFQFIKFFLSVFRHVSWIPSWVISTDCSQCKVRNVFSNLFGLLSKFREYRGDNKTQGK